MTAGSEMSAARKSTHGVRIGSVAGVPIYLGRSWFLVAILIVAAFGPVLARNRPDLGVLAYGVAACFVLLLLISVLVHEAAHAVAARLNSYRVSRIVADFWGGHTAYDAVSARPAASAVVAIAGPVANGILAGLGYLIVQVAPAGVPTFLATAFAVANAIVAGFNLLPGLPLDGGYLVEAVVWRITGRRSTGTIAAGWAGRVLVVLGVVILVAVPLLRREEISLMQIVIIAALGAFLWAGASAAVRTGRVRSRLDAVTVGELLHPVRVQQADTPLRAAGSSPVPGELGSDRLPVVVLDDTGVPVGLLDPRAAAQVDLRVHPHTPVAAVTARFPPGWVVNAGPDDSIAAVMPALEQHRVSAVAVRDHTGRIIGLVRARSVVDLLR